MRAIQLSQNIHVDIGSKICQSSLRSRVWINVRPTENDSTRLCKNGDISAVISVACSNLVGRKSKCYFIIKFSLLLSTRLCLREIRPDAGKATEMSLLKIFSDITTQRSRFGRNSCAADEQACVFDICRLNEHSVLKTFMINGLNFQTM